MIQTVTVTATAQCLNCRTEVKRGKGDLEATERWWHEKGGRPECPSSPVAEPTPGTVRELAITCPRCGWTSFHPEDVKQGYCGNCHAFTGVDNPGSTVHRTEWHIEPISGEGKPEGVALDWVAFCVGCGEPVASRKRRDQGIQPPKDRPVHIHPPSGVNGRDENGVCRFCGSGPANEHTKDCLHGR